MNNLILFVFLIPFCCLSQVPFDTDNYEFQVKQKQKMLKLGYHRVDVKKVDSEIKTGKVIYSSERWTEFDNVGHFRSDGTRKNGRDSINDTRTYRADGKYLGETDQNGNGRAFFYDEHDSLVRIQYVPNHPFSILYFYDQLNDSTTLVREYYSDTSRLETIKRYVRSQNITYCFETRNGKELPESKVTHNSKGQITESIRYQIPGYHQEETQRYTYDGSGRKIKWEVDQIGSNSLKEYWEFTYVYDSTGNLVLEQKWERLQEVVERWTYEFKNNLLVKEIQFNKYAEPNEIITTYTYFSNGLLKTSSKQSGYDGEYRNITSYSYK